VDDKFFPDLVNRSIIEETMVMYVNILVQNVSGGDRNTQTLGQHVSGRESKS
jgi:hypothetical protein